jgi:hypothetical protein
LKSCGEFPIRHNVSELNAGSKRKPKRESLLEAATHTKRNKVV